MLSEICPPISEVNHSDEHGYIVSYTCRKHDCCVPTYFKPDQVDMYMIAWLLPAKYLPRVQVCRVLMFFLALAYLSKQPHLTFKTKPVSTETIRVFLTCFAIEIKVIKARSTLGCAWESFSSYIKQ